MCLDTQWLILLTPPNPNNVVRLGLKKTSIWTTVHLFRN